MTSQIDLEQQIAQLNVKIDYLKSQYNLYVAGEVRVPPEKEREEVEKVIQHLLYAENKSPRTAMLIQNLAARFSLYNNMWLKKLNEIETGVTPLQRKKIQEMPVKKKPAVASAQVVLNLNDERTFDELYESYCQVAAQVPISAMAKEKIVEAVKKKLIFANLVNARVVIELKNDKVSFRLKK